MEKANLFFIVSVLVFLFSLFLIFKTYGSLADFSKMTGKAVDSSLINLTINELAMVNFTVDSVDWGAGYVFLNASYSYIDTLGNIHNGTWDPVGSGFVIKNIGNVNLSLSFQTGKDAGSFIGGSNPSYKYRISNVEPDACTPSFGLDLEEFYEIPASGTLTKICEPFVVGKSIAFDLALQIPIDSLAGNLSDEVTLSFNKA